LERASIEVPVDPLKYPLALRLIAEGKVDVRSLISHEVRLGEVVEFFRALSEGKFKAVKALVKPGDGP